MPENSVFHEIRVYGCFNVNGDIVVAKRRIRDKQQFSQRDGIGEIFLVLCFHIADVSDSYSVGNNKASGAIKIPVTRFAVTVVLRRCRSDNHQSYRQIDNQMFVADIFSGFLFLSADIFCRSKRCDTQFVLYRFYNHRSGRSGLGIDAIIRIRVFATRTV
jgi:hypothetical protein